MNRLRLCKRRRYREHLSATLDMGNVGLGLRSQAMGQGIHVQLITGAGLAVGKQMEVQTGYRVRARAVD